MYSLLLFHFLSNLKIDFLQGQPIEDHIRDLSQGCPKDVVLTLCLYDHSALN